MKSILLTGATGFLGSHLLEALLANGYKVVILKRSNSNTWRIAHLLDQVDSYDVDIQRLELAFERNKIDLVIHTACQYGRNNAPLYQVVESNLMFGLQILDACLKFNTKTFINTDTFFNTGTPLQNHLNVYSLAKKQFVEWLKQQSSKIQIINLKLEHMYGPKDNDTKFIPWLLSQLVANVPEIKLTKGEQQRDFIYIDDVVSAYLISIEKSSTLESFKTFDVGTGKLITVKDLLLIIKQTYEMKFGESMTKFKFGAIPYGENELMTVETNNSSLKELGWNDFIPIELGINYLLQDKSSLTKI